MPAPKGNQYARGNKGGGRKTSYKTEYAEQAHKLCQTGFTDQMLGQFFEVNESTINRWKLEHEEFVQALRVGKDVADAVVERSTFIAINGFTRVVKKVVGQGKNARVEEVEEYYPPQAGAGLKWLAARQPEQYQQKAEQKPELSVSEGLRATLEVMSERSRLLRAERARLANQAKSIEHKAEVVGT